MEVCPVCGCIEKIDGRCKYCNYDFKVMHAHTAITRLRERLANARTMYTLGLFSIVLWPVGVPFGVTAGAIVLAIGIIGTSFGVGIGLSRASRARRALRAGEKLLPQLPEARATIRE